MATLNEEIISKISAAEQNIAHQCDCTEDGPTAAAHNHSGEALNAQNVLHDITEGEKHITHQASGARPIAGGPTAVAQSILAKANNPSNKADEHHSGKLDPETISKITDAEKKISGSDADVVAGGPTAMAQKHAGEDLRGQNVLHDITEGEKKVTHQPRPVAGGPTAVAQSEIAKAVRQGNNDDN